MMIGVTSLVLTYNPQWEKLKFTLDSLVRQVNISQQIVIADDGSENNLFENISEYMGNIGFDNYVLVGNQHNQGTVKNLQSGLEKATGKFIKPISPGDALLGENCLETWVSRLIESNRRWSFSEAQYYNTLTDGSIEYIPYMANPQLNECYLEQRDLDCRWNYIILDDLALGAAVLVESELYKEYITRIVGKVIYGEDSSYILMMYDGIVPYYYNDIAVLYECGNGVSTSNSKVWKKRMKCDFDAIYTMIIDSDNLIDKFQKRIQRVCKYKLITNRCLRVFLMLFEKNYIRITLKRLFRPRMIGYETSSKCINNIL